MWAVCMLACAVLWGILFKISHSVDEKIETKWIPSYTGTTTSSYSDDINTGMFLLKDGWYVANKGVRHKVVPFCIEPGQTECYYYVPKDSGNLSWQEPECLYKKSPWYDSKPCRELYEEPNFK